MKTIFQKTLAIPKEKLLLLLFAVVRNEHETDQFLQAILTPVERHALEERADIFRGLVSKKTQRIISQQTGASLATVSRGNREIKFGNGIIQKLFKRI